MADYLTISKQAPAFPPYLDFQSLRAIGLDHLQQLSSELWTDYNLHDPGVTILEVLCYAVTDLGYRNNLDIQDLLALNPKDPAHQENNFFTPNEILTCNPVTILDWRQRLVDIPGVRNAWIEPVIEVGDPIRAAEVVALLTRTGDPDHPHLVRPALYANCTTEKLQFGYPDLPEYRYHRLNPRGLYDVCLDLEPEPHKDACGVVHRSRGKILEAVRSVLCHYRNLCEDFRDVIVLGEEEIAVCADIELTAAAEPEDVLVAIYVAVQAFLAPRVTFYTLQEMLARGKTTAEIFAGRPAADLDDPATATPYSDCPADPADESARYPGYASHGFIDVDELQALELPTEIHASDLYQVIMDVPGVAAIKKLNLINYINGLRQSEGHPWCLKLTEKHRPVLGLDQSTITFFKGDLPFRADSAAVKQRYQERQAAYIKAQKEPSELDLPVPRGTYFDLADHYSIHHDFPLTYGIGEDGLPSTVSAQRKAQAKQLKGYLIFFDQLLANYLAQLSHVRDLFAWERESDRAPSATQPDRRRTHFTQGLANVPCAEDILKNFHRCSGSDLPGAAPIDYTAYLDFITESPETYYARRHRFLDHLLGRFAETFADYVLLNYRLSDGHRRPESDIIDDKAQFLKDYPVLGRDRFRAFNYCRCGDVWGSNNVSGFKRRVSRLLGIDDFSRRDLSPYRVEPDPGGYQLVLQKAAAGDAETVETNDIEVTAESVDLDPAAIRFTSRGLYGTAAEAQAALAELKQAALEPDRYRRLAYRSFHHYGWELWAEGRAIATFERFDRNPAQADPILDDLLGALRLRQVPLPLVMVEQITAAVADVTTADITLGAGVIALALTTPITESDSEVEAGAEAIAALLTALQTVFLAAEVDEALITTAFAAPILLAIGQMGAPAAQLQVAVQAAPSGEDYSSATPVVLRPPVLVTTVDFGAASQTAQIEVQTAAASAEQPFADFTTQVIAPDAAILIWLGQDDSDRWSLQIHLPTIPESPDAGAPADPLTVLRERLALTLPAAVESALAFPRLTLTEDADNFLTFELVLPPAIATAAPLTFTGSQRHPSAAIAQAVAFQALGALGDRDRYQTMTRRREDGTPETFTYHGYGILDAEGQLLAESSDRFATVQERDLQLQRWLTCLRANQNQFRVEPATECFFVELRDRAGEEIWLLGAVGVSSHAAALTQQTLLLETGKHRAAYELTETTTDAVTTYSFALGLGDRLLARHPDTYLLVDRADQPRYATAVERDLWLNALLYYLNQPEPTAFISGEVGTYQATLLDRDGQPLLITYHSYATRNLTEAAYQRLLYLASDPVYFQIINDLEDDHPYGFSLIDRRGRTFATHPGRYITACERDLAIRNIANYVNKELTLQFPEREGGFYIDLLDQTGTVLLAGDLPYASEAAATAAAGSLLSLARVATNYQLLNDGDGDCPHGFALVDGDERLATHPTYYALESERDQALQALISCVVDDDPDYTIDGVEGQFSYGLVDVLAAGAVVEDDLGETTEDDLVETSEDAAGEGDEVADAVPAPDDNSTVPIGPLLLTSAVLYPDAEAARQGFDTLIELGADAAHYHRVDDLPAPNAYGFELRDEGGEVIARPLTAAGEVIGYSTAQERDAAIAKILYYLAQPEIKVEITNPEGAFFAEIYNQQHELVWSGQRTLPSPTAAEAEAALIQQLAGMPALVDPGDPYPYQVRSSPGSCPQSFDLVMAAESGESEEPDEPSAATDPARVLIARHPWFYDNEAARDRTIQQLRLHFSENLADFIETPAVETEAGTCYGFALPARYFCAFGDCDADQQDRLATGSLLGPPPDPDTNSPQPVIYATAAEARDKFIEALSFASGLNHFFEIYKNEDCLNNPNAQPFRFELKASGDRPAKAEDPMIATSARTYHSRAEMWAVIHFLQQLAQGFPVTVATPGTHCGYYFYLDLPIESAEPVALRSLQRYPSETRAWEAAGAFTENVRFLNHYLGPGEVEGTAYGFAIGDEAGTPLAIAASDLDPLEVFQVLNNLEDSLRITAVESEESGYRFQLIEPMGDDEARVWLQGLTVHPDAASATTQFYRDILGRLLEPEAIDPYYTPSGFSFRLTLPSADPEAPPTVIALHPQPGTEADYQFYPTAADRDRAIAQLKTAIRTVGVDVRANPVGPALVGEVVGADGTVLLRATRSEPSPEANPDQQRAEVWAYSDTLIELAQDRDNIRWIDDEEGTCFFSWELTNRSKYPVLAAPVAQYGSAKDREDAIAALQARLNDEGFHVLEHILLRPQQLLPPPPPCEVEEPEANPTEAETVEDSEPAAKPLNEVAPDLASILEPLLPIPLQQTDCKAAAEQNIELCRTSYDPYSFWVSVVLPYWPERFRNMNFRRFVERTLRLEAPAHVALKICWIGADQMHQFDQAYRSWIEQFALNACEDAACDLPGSLTTLVNILTRLENVYPQGTLHDCEASDAEDNPIILDQTALGTSEDA